ncbi:MAG: histidinol-phosphate transaminase [Ardenticatenaceae bacterium]|nr:histidinol-phosphate transaminase [Ardenticatenaceae bacterium]
MKIPHFKNHVQQSPIYRGGISYDAIREKYGLEDIVKLSSNENPLPTSDVVKLALAEAIKTLNRYPPASDDDLRLNLAAYIGRQTTADQFITGNGGCDVLDLIAQSFLEEGDEAIICPPTFPVYELTVKRTGGTVVHVPLQEDFSLDVDGILSAVTDKTCLLYLCSPNNPTGSIVKQADFERLMAGLPETVIVVSDEVYYHFNEAADAVNTFPYLDRNLIILHSFSKVFGLAGMRLGYGIARPELADYLRRARLPFHINSLTKVAASVGLTDRSYIEETISLTVNERGRLYQAMSQMAGVKVWPSQANFLLFQTEREDVAEALQKKGTIVRELGGFYMPGFLRVSVGQTEENDRFLAHLQEVLR